MIRIGIVGYGNLGKEVERQLIEKQEYELVAIFSRRENITSEYGTKIQYLYQLKDGKDMVNGSLQG